MQQTAHLQGLISSSGFSAVDLWSNRV